MTPLGAWLDKYADKLSGLTATEAAARAESAAALARVQAKQTASVAPENITATVSALVKQKNATETLAKASALLGFEVTELSTAERVLAIQEENSADGRKKSTEEQKKARSAAAELAKELKKLDFAISGQAFSLEQATEVLNRYLSTWREFKPVDLTQDILDLNAALGQGPELDPSVIGSQIAAGQRALADFGLGAQLKASFKTALADLPAVILGAFQGGGDVGKAVGAHLGGSIGTSLGERLGPALSGVLGKTLGSAIGSLAGPLGSILGSLVGNLIGKIGNLFGNKEIMKLNDIRDAFLSANGGWLALQQELAKGTDEDLVKEIFDAKTVEAFNAAVAKVEAVLAEIRGNTEPIVIPVQFDVQGGPAAAGEPVDLGDLPEFASGGIGDFGSGTLAMLHGREAIVPLDRIGTAGVGGTVTVESAPVINIQMANAPVGDVVAELERALDQHAAGLEARFGRIARRAVNG
jgi:hypothetical protein